MFRSFFFCLALVGASTAFGQQRATLNGVEGTFFPAAHGPTPVADPMFQQPVQQRQQTVVQEHQHASNCGCPVCKRTLLQKNKTVKSKIITEVVTTEVFQDDLPVQFFNESPPPAVVSRNPCPPKDPCIQHRHGGGSVLPVWHTGLAYRPQPCSPRPMPPFIVARPVQPVQKQCSVNLFGLLRVSATSGPSGYVQQRYYGDPGYGGFGYPSQPVRPW